MIITLADLKCWLSVNERRNILVGVTHPLERCGQDTGRAKTRQTPPRKIAATDNRGPKTGSCALTEKGAKQPLRSSTLDAMRSSWRLETGPSWRLVPGGIKVRWSSAFPINSLRLPMTSHGLCRPFLDGTPRTPSTPTVGRPASLPHQMIRRMSPSHPRICYEALPLPLAVLKLGGVVRAPSRLVPPEISTCVPILSADLDLCIHLLNVRLQPYSLSGGQPPTGRSGWWVLLPAGRLTKFLRSVLSRRIQRGTFVLRLLPCRPQRVGDTRSASAAGTLVSVQPSRV
ncbi:hypothetical protein T02_15778 [Trichinella nativa]|uniref:Uncharacterized protein n=1 Tax=Trichinella nativa TaxID=6335 RepID=A0A0V1KV67_9BILA|nr:hypothetical protein T02_15778 [Trichinella nativa]